MTASLYSSLPLTVYMQYGVEALGQNGRPSYTTIVLLFVVRTGNGVRTPFSPSHVVAWAREELGLDLDRRRVYEDPLYIILCYTILYCVSMYILTAVFTFNRVIKSV